MKRILLPVDGSETCNKSFETAKEIALKFGSEVIVLMVKPPYEQIFHAPDLSHKEYHDEHYHALAERILSSAVAKFDGSDIKVTSKVEDGHIASTIIDFAEKEDIDLIVMCTHGMSGIKRYTMGSVTHKVVMHATVSVMVVR